MLICRTHKRAIKGLDRHLKDTYRLKTKKERQLIVNCYARLTLAKPKDVAILLTNIALFKALRDLEKAY